jgi:predicted solute-binding protein
MTRTRIGTVGYLNAVPLTSEIDRDRYEVVADHPRGITAKLVAREVEVALAPVAGMLDDGDFRVVPGWCIGADGAVHSVLLVAETPPESWTEVVLDGESRTSVVLAQLLLRRGPLAERVRTDIPVRTVEPGAGVEAARGTVAAVVIGDAARVLPDRLTHRLDLAELWKRWTGKPFVFAVWAAHPGLSQTVVDELRRAGTAGTAAIRDRYTGDDLTYLTEYIRYPLDEDALIGLRRFAAMAHREGLVARHDIALVEPEIQPRAVPDAVEDSLLAAADGTAPTEAQARAWLAHLRDGELHVAAHQRRLDLHGAAHASYLVQHVADDGFDAVAEAGASAVRAGATAERIAAAAAEGLGVSGVDVRTPDLDALATAGLRAVTWRVGDDVPAAVYDAAAASLLVEAVVDLSVHEDVIAALFTVRKALPTGVIASVRVTTALPDGALVEPGRATTARWLRAVALARLVLPEVTHIGADPAALGSDASQAALFVGADDFGAVGAGVVPREGAARFEVSLEEAERVLRVAGFQPTRRELGFEALGGPLTRLRRIRRPEERATP